MSDLSKLSNAEFMERLLSAAAIADTLMAGGGVLLREAASRLQAPAVAEVEAVRAALEKFSWFADYEVTETGCWRHPPMRERIADWFGPSDFHAARSALRTGGSE